MPSVVIASAPLVLPGSRIWTGGVAAETNDRTPSARTIVRQKRQLAQARTTVRFFIQGAGSVLPTTREAKCFRPPRGQTRAIRVNACAGIATEKRVGSARASLTGTLQAGLARRACSRARLSGRA